ncbi:MAG: LamG domain-containing protein [Planctomycetota bacterium]
MLTWHVDGVGGDNSNDGLTRETAFATIQKGVNTAEDCDRVMVWPGVYEPFYIFDKEITVKSADEPAVIDGGFDDDAVALFSGYKETVLKNFVIKNGFAGVYVYNGQPELANLTIVDCNTGIKAETGAEPNIVSAILWDNDYDLWNCTAQYSFVEEDFDANLVSYWKLDGDAVDSAGTNNGTIYGAVPTTGQINDALDFNGNDVHVRIPDDDSISVGRQDYTISAWINPRSLTGPDGAGTIVSKVKNSEDKEYLLQILDGVIRFSVEKNVNNQIAETTTAPVETGYWQHIVVTFKSSTTTPTIYYNRAVQTSTSNIDTLPDELDDDLYIGMNGGAYYTNEFNGTIDDVRIYDKALSAKEIEAMYEAGLARLEYPDPLFADANSGDYHLLSERGRYRTTSNEWLLDDVSSPAIDGGDPYASLASERQPNGGRVNMGAYGGTTEGSRSEWPFAGDLNLDGVVNLADFAILAEDWLEVLPWAE